MRIENIPTELRHLIDQAKKWGIGDDGYRDEQIELATTEELKSLISIFDEKTLMCFNDWLSDEDEAKNSTDEYVLFTCFLMAFEYAEAIYNDRLLGHD